MNIFVIEETKNGDTEIWQSKTIKSLIANLKVKIGDSNAFFKSFKSYESFGEYLYDNYDYENNNGMDIVDIEPEHKYFSVWNDDNPDSNNTKTSLNGGTHYQSFKKAGDLKLDELNFWYGIYFSKLSYTTMYFGVDQAMEAIKDNPNKIGHDKLREVLNIQ